MMKIRANFYFMFSLREHKKKSGCPALIFFAAGATQKKFKQRLPSLLLLERCAFCGRYKVRCNFERLTKRSKITKKTEICKGTQVFFFRIRKKKRTQRHLAIFGFFFVCYPLRFVEGELSTATNRAHKKERGEGFALPP